MLDQDPDLVNSADDDDADLFQAVSFEDEKVKSSKLEFYKGTKNVSDRLAILMNPVVAVHTHYHQGNFICRTRDNGPMEICCEKLGPPTMRFGTIVAHYGTNKEGVLNDLKNPSYTLKAWILSEDKYFTIREIHREWSIDQVDLKVRCTEETYQRLDINPCKDSAIRKNPVLNTRVSKEVEQLKPRLKQVIAKKLSISEIKERLGLDVAISSPGQSTKVDLSSLVNDLD